MLVSIVEGRNVWVARLLDFFCRKPLSVLLKFLPLFLLETVWKKIKFRNLHPAFLQNGPWFNVGSNGLIHIKNCLMYQSLWIFQGEKILSTSSFGGEVKPYVPCRIFTACKRSLNVTWKSGIFRQNSSAISLAHVLPPLAVGISRRRLVAEVGTFEK